MLSRRDGKQEIYVVDADGSGLRNLTRSPEHEFAPAWLPAPVGVHDEDIAPRPHRPAAVRVRDLEVRLRRDRRTARPRGRACQEERGEH